jgi:salicylate biosynthesis isochorismate synthase
MIDTLLQHAAEEIGHAVDRARERRTRVVLTVSAAITFPGDLLSLVQRAGSSAQHCFLWERPADNFAVAAWGTSASFCAEGAGRFSEIAAACEAALRDAAADAASRAIGAPFFVGGFAFAPNAVEDEPWRGFPAALMLLPRLLIVRREQTATLTATCVVDAASDAAAVLQRLRANLEQMQRSAASACNEDARDSVAVRYQAAPTAPLPLWKQAVADTVDDITRGRLDKLVLARSCVVTSNRRFDCGRILRHLRTTYPSCVLFWIGTPHGEFLGATPEPLVRSDRGRITTAAVAGSAAPGTSAAAARSLADALAHSEKDRAEHAIVVRAISETLRPLCEQLDVAPSPQVLRLDNVQHLMTPISGRLRDSHHILDLVARLHPSPAVAGHPRAAALQLLHEREGLNRGWYAGPIGWMDARHDGEFVVAIRSALVRGSQAALYAGAGIVAGSDPEAELSETRMKLQPLLSALLEL